MRAIDHALLQRGQEAVFAVEHERHLGHQREVHVLAGDRCAGRDEAGVTAHDLHDRNTVMHAVRFGVRAVDHLGRLLDGGEIAESPRNEGDVVVDRLRHADDGQRMATL